MRLASLLLLAALVGCGGEGVSTGNDAQLRLTGRRNDYNGDYSDFGGSLGVEIRTDTTLTVNSGGRRFRLILNEDVLGKGQVYDMANANEARATYDEGSDEVWVAVSGRAEVTEEILGKFTVRLSDLEFEPADDEENEAVGGFDLDGTLRRR